MLTAATDATAALTVESLNQEIEQALLDFDDDAVIAKYKVVKSAQSASIEIKKSSIMRLRADLGEGSWLDGDIIEAMARHILKDNKIKLAGSTFLYEKMKDPPDGAAWRHDSMASWTRRSGIHSQKRIPLIVHEGGVHWLMVCVNVELSVIEVIDPSGVEHSQVCSDVLRWLKAEGEANKGKCDWHVRKWCVQHTFAHTQQKNMYDCGVFVLGYIRALVASRHYGSFQQQGCLQMRHDVFQWIVHGTGPLSEGTCCV